ncbi:hypothetical protein BH23PSE1_BH23PSE1_18220 [soil metagenome]
MPPLDPPAADDPRALRPLDQARLIAEVVERLRGDGDLHALLLGGSLGRSAGDRFSDVDLLAVAEAAAHERLAARWRAVIEAIAPIVYWNERRGASVLVNAITAEWLRCDLSIVAPGRLTGASKATLRPLIDPAGLFAALPERLPPRVPDRDRVERLVREFLRVLGLLPVGVGRGEYVTAARGAGLLRDMLIDLMLELSAEPHPAGALHLGLRLPPEDMDLLERLPPPRPDRDGAIAANVAAAASFLPRARRAARALDFAWHDAFEAATLRHLRTELGIDPDALRG